MEDTVLAGRSESRTLTNRYQHCGEYSVNWSILHYDPVEETVHVRDEELWISGDVFRAKSAL